MSDNFLYQIFCKLSRPGPKQKQRSRYMRTLFGLTLAHLLWRLYQKTRVESPSYLSEDWGWTCANVSKRLRNAISYCDYQAGRTRGRAPRWNPDADWYISGLRLLRAALAGDLEPSRLQIALPVLHPSPSPTIQEKELAEQPRLWLVSELLKADSRYTDKKLLSHLPRPKLAHMLAEAWAACAQMQRVTA